MAEVLLDRGAESVTIVDASPPATWWRLAGVAADARFRGLHVDVRDQPVLVEAFAGNDLVVHMASSTNMQRGAVDPTWDFQNGTVLTMSVLEAVRAASVPRLLFVSSSAVYGDLAAQRAAREDDGPLLPISTYGASKLAGEGLVSAYSALFGLSARIFRPATVVGLKMDHGVIHDLVRQVRAGEPRLRIVGNGRQRRSFLLAEECVDGMLHIAAHHGPPCAVYNLGSDGLTSVAEVVEIVLDEAGYRPGQVDLDTAERGWPGDVPVVGLDLSRLHATGWRAPHASTEAVRECVRRMLVP